MLCARVVYQAKTQHGALRTFMSSKQSGRSSRHMRPRHRGLHDHAQSVSSVNGSGIALASSASVRRAPTGAKREGTLQMAPEDDKLDLTCRAFPSAVLGRLAGNLDSERSMFEIRDGCARQSLLVSASQLYQYPTRADAKSLNIDATQRTRTCDSKPASDVHVAQACAHGLKHSGHLQACKRVETDVVCDLASIWLSIRAGELEELDWQAFHVECSDGLCEARRAARSTYAPRTHLFDRPGAHTSCTAFVCLYWTRVGLVMHQKRTHAVATGKVRCRAPPPASQLHHLRQHQYI